MAKMTLLFSFKNIPNMMHIVLSICQQREKDIIYFFQENEKNKKNEHLTNKKFIRGKCISLNEKKGLQQRIFIWYLNTYHIFSYCSFCFIDLNISILEIYSKYLYIYSIVSTFLYSSLGCGVRQAKR